MELLGHAIVFFFNFLKNLHIIFPIGCANLQSHQQCTRVLFSPYPCQHLLCLIFLIIDILTGIKWYLIVVLICISLVTSDFWASFHVSVVWLISRNIYSCPLSIFKFSYLSFCCWIISQDFLGIKSGWGLPWWLSGKESTCQRRRCRFHPWSR